MIKIDKLVKIFPTGARALNELSLEVGEGEILALLGPNGAGKTTTIRTATTLCGFDSGKITLAGHDVDREPQAIRACIGLVAQQTGVDYFLTGRENLRLFGHLYHLRARDINPRITELSEYFELDSVLDDVVTTYSGGTRRRLDIATALMHRPRVVFLDEPTLGLDIKSRRNLWRYVRKLNSELGLTILLTTHYLEEADQLAHRVAIINKGRICAVDTPDALKRQVGGDAIIVQTAGGADALNTLQQGLQDDPIVRKLIREDERLNVYVDHGATAIPVIAARAGELKVVLREVTLTQPSLDDVFLQYTGNRLDSDTPDTQTPWWQQWAGKGGGGKWAKKWQQQNDSKTSEASAETQNETSWHNEWNKGNPSGQTWDHTAEQKNGQAASAPQDSGQNDQSPPSPTTPPEGDWPTAEQLREANWQQWQKKDNTGPRGKS
jgi:ABC-2 type transport system ATP-binding protein